MYEYDYYLDDVKTEQGKLFELVSNNNISLLDYVPRYFTSRMYESIDNRNPRYTTMSAEDIFDLTKREHFEYAKPDMYALWYGQVYATLHSELGIPSKVLYFAYPITLMKERFNPDIDEVLDQMLDEAYIFSDDDPYFSPVAQHTFEVNGIKFSSVLQYVYYRKAMMSKDFALADDIIKIDNIMSIKTLARTIKTLDIAKWNEIKSYIMYTALVNCIWQNEDLEGKIKEFRNRLVLYANKDLFLGIGLPKSAQCLLDTDKWRGQNNYGWAVMKALAQTERNYT